MNNPVTMFVIGISIALTLLSAFYLGRITTHLPTPVCALGRATEYPVLKPLYVKLLANTLMPVRGVVLKEMTMRLPPTLPRGRHVR